MFLRSIFTMLTVQPWKVLKELNLGSSWVLYFIFAYRIIDKETLRIYRDGRVKLLCKINKKQTNKLRKNVIRSVFQSFGWKIEVVTNLTEVEFLDVTFHLERKTYHLYKKLIGNYIIINISSENPRPHIKDHQATH